MSLTRVEPTAIDSNATFVFANATVNANLITSNLSANTIAANTISVAGIATFSNVANIRIPNGVANTTLLTDGSGNLRWGVPNAAVANTITANAQPNITSVGNLTNIVISNTSATATSPVNIQETWNNSSIAFNGIALNVTDTASSAGANLINLSVNTVSRFSVNKTGAVTATNANLGNVASANFLSGTLTTSFQPNITSIGQLSVLAVTSNITAGNATVSGSLYGAIQGIVGGQTPNSATFTSVSINNNASIIGNLTAANANLGNAVRANFFLGDGGLLSNVGGGIATSANYANFAGTVITANQPNITSVGTLSSLTVSGNISAGNVSGTIATSSQPFITNIGTLSSITVTGNSYMSSLVAKSSLEYMQVKTSATGSINYNYNEGTVYYHTMQGNVNINFINVPSALDAAAVFVLVVNQGITPYSFSSVSIDGTLQTIKWLGGVVPTATASKTESYSFTLFRATGSWIVAGQMNSYG